jgi:hypothetical protein
VLELSPGYIRDLASQIGFLSAFLGGFAATLFGVLLTTTKENKAVGVSIALSALAGIAFIVAVIASTQVNAVTHPEAPALVAQRGFKGGQVAMSAGFMLGVYSLLGCIGFAGWARSRTTGIVTSIIAAAGVIAVTLALATL